MTITLAFSLLAYHNVRRVIRLQLLVIRQRLTRQMAVMTLARVLVLIVCGLPFICSSLWELNINTHEDNYLELAIFSLISSILDSVFYANFAINFYVFLMVSSRFRRQVKNVLLRKCWALVKTRRHETPSYMYSVGLDIGTTSCKICVVTSSSSSSSNESNRVVFTEQITHNAHIIQNEFPSFDEQSTSKILETVNILLEKSGILNNDFPIKSIQICGQMHGFMLWSSKSSRTKVSSLVTWQDQRCSTEFFSTLGSSLAHLRTGYGLATLLWLINEQNGKEDKLMEYDRAGTIADYIATILCEDSEMKSQISTQMATSWGALNCQWSIEHRLLPTIVEPGTIIGYWKTKVPVYVALGDLQCSVFSCQPDKNQCVMNISTSAQLALTVDREVSTVSSPQNDSLSSASVSSSMRVPYFDSKDLLVAASLNGGNILSAFVQLIHSWHVSLYNVSSLSLDSLWSRLIELGLHSSSTIENFSAALFGERHDPSMAASITNIRSMNMAQLNDIGVVFRSMCRWIIKNLFEMLGRESLTMECVIGTGSALMRNDVLQRELKEKVKCQVIFEENSDAAYGAALFALMR
ncbi:unnamed protein product [Rotaria socialis]|uniref:Carbohydrate kinase FGGY N-terminal domain-containing protein n=1 Tax=Rotaria socialis TaxID=392032 RepID=A0A819VLG7_9BILA|nr:unnamed protein product [Rotaria socialis]CAF3443780.1 unnamed protein product [Rotaria socialis]CAF4110678.1 unnamed protein product [Rotaria socialis]CAF4187188.1 unnamed protein product [Rotaria socialis]